MRLRDFKPGDRNAVNAVHRAVWWRERSHAGWSWLDDNPARQEIGAASGWVIEDASGDAGAFVGNLVHRFWFEGRPLHAATGFSIIVPPQLRGGSRLLIKAFLEQPGVAGGYTLNANPISHGIYRRRGLIAHPPGTDGLKLSWIIDPASCAAGRVLRHAVDRWPGVAAMAGEAFMNRRLERHDGRKDAPPVHVLDDLSEGSDYDHFWRALRDEGVMIGDRSPEILRWRLADPDQTYAPLLLAYRRGRRITGYAMAMMGKGTSIEPPCLEILDVQALADEMEAPRILTQSLIRRAGAMGAAKVRLQVVSPRLLQALGDLGRSARREGGWGHCLAAFRERASDFSDWQPTPFDGDYGVYTRPPPVGEARRSLVDRRARNVGYSKA